ncbi:MAG: hypothetical protein RIF33_10805 [Cyclobacteriaceae bacterium]
MGGIHDELWNRLDGGFGQDSTNARFPSLLSFCRSSFLVERSGGQESVGNERHFTLL